VADLRETINKLTASIKQMDETNVRILDATMRVGPRNILDIGKSSGLPATTVYARFKRFRDFYGSLVSQNVMVSKLGLARTGVFVKGERGKNGSLAEKLDSTGYLTANCVLNGSFDAYFQLELPRNVVADFKRVVLDQFSKEDQKTEFVDLSDFVFQGKGYAFYEPLSAKWKFDWPRWVSDVLSLKEQSFGHTDGVVRFDSVDLYILKELQLDGTTTYTSIARKIGMTPQVIRKRYLRLSELGVLGEYVYGVAPYPEELSEWLLVKMNFSNVALSHAFASSVTNMFWAKSYVPALTWDSAILEAQILRGEELGFMEFLESLVSKGVLSNYLVFREVPESRRRKTLPVDMFRNGEWCVDFRVLQK